MNPAVRSHGVASGIQQEIPCTCLVLSRPPSRCSRLPRPRLRVASSRITRLHRSLRQRITLQRSRVVLLQGPRRTLRHRRVQRALLQALRPRRLVLPLRRVALQHQRTRRRRRMRQQRRQRRRHLRVSRFLLHRSEHWYRVGVITRHVGCGGTASCLVKVDTASLPA